MISHKQTVNERDNGKNLKNMRRFSTQIFMYPRSPLQYPNNPK